MVFFGRYLVRRKVVVGEADGREAVTSAAKGDDARGAGHGRAGAGGCAEQREEQVGQEEGADVVSAELLLDALGRGVARRDDDAGVVDEEVEMGGELGDGGGGGAD